MPTLSPWVPTAAIAVGVITLINRAEQKAVAELRGVAEEDDGHGELAPLLLALALPRVTRALDRWLANAIIGEVVRRTGEQAGAAAARQWSAEVSRAVGREVVTDPAPSLSIVQRWIAENTARIQGLRNTSLERIRADLEAAVATGKRPSQLAAEWERDGIPTAHGRLRGRAKVIAVTQLQLLAAQMAEAQARALGVMAYQWDANIGARRLHRLHHLDRHGQVYSWDAPPADGHPGHAINCRCMPRPVIARERVRSLAG